MGTSRRSIAAASLAAGAVLSLGAAVPAQAAPKLPATTTVDSCKAVYQLNGLWKGGDSEGFTSTLRFYNTNPAPITDWTLTFTFGSSSAQVTKLWSGDFVQTGQTVTVTPAPYQLSIQPGKQLTIGFIATGANANPTSVTLSGTACTETASKGKVVPGVAAALGNALEAQAAAGQASGATLTALRHRVTQMKRDERRDNVKAEISHLRGFIRQFHWKRAAVEVTPAGTDALLGVADATMDSLL